MKFLFGRKPDLRAEAEKLARYDVAPEVRAQLATWMAEAPARELFRTNPYLVAERLQIAPRLAIKLLVQALYEGLFTLHWELKCPGCGSFDTEDTLAHLTAAHTCTVCHNIYGTDADDNVRVTFSIDERLRPLGDAADDPIFRQGIDLRHGPVSGHTLLTLQAFRDLFPNQTLPPSESMLVRRVALLFTDLAGSTALYLRRGDPRAYELVRQHFDRLFATVDAEGGVVIKTIGDAVMGAFTSPVAAVRAALAMHDEVAMLNRQLRLADLDMLVLKVGLHTGPCISVNLNGRMDYFGTAVNTAARIQGTSAGGDIALSAAMLDDPEAQALLAHLPLAASELVLRGFETPLRLFHVVLEPATMAADAAQQAGAEPWASSPTAT